MAAAALTASLVPLSLLPASPAHAQTIGDLQQQAAQIQQQIDGLHDQIESHAEEYNRARARSDAAQADVDRANTELSTTQAELAARRRQLSDYAVQAYVTGGDYSAVDSLLGGGDPDAANRRLSYLKTASGDRRQLLDQLKASQQDLDRKLAAVQQAKADADAQAQQADQARQDAADAEARLNQLLAGVQGQVADLVRQQEEQRAAEEAARAQAAAAQARQQQAEEQASLPAASTSASTASTTSADAATVTSAPRPAPVVSWGGRAAAQTALAAAMSQIGVPYVYGGASPGEGFDCSGLVMWAWAAAGRSLSHAADWQRDETQPISRDELQPGDLVFYGEPPSHDGIYIGDGMIVNAPHTGALVRVQSMDYSSKPITFGRVN
jgi:cell wall-associated NlpC family hydrolase